MAIADQLGKYTVLESGKIIKGKRVYPFADVPKPEKIPYPDFPTTHLVTQYERNIYGQIIGRCDEEVCNDRMAYAVWKRKCRLVDERNAKMEEEYQKANKQWHDYQKKRLKEVAARYKKQCRSEKIWNNAMKRYADIKRKNVFPKKVIKILGFKITLERRLTR